MFFFFSSFLTETPSITAVNNLNKEVSLWSLYRVVCSSQSNVLWSSWWILDGCRLTGHEKFRLQFSQEIIINHLGTIEISFFRMKVKIMAKYRNDILVYSWFTGVSSFHSHKNFLRAVRAICFLISFEIMWKLHWHFRQLLIEMRVIRLKTPRQSINANVCTLVSVYATCEKRCMFL